MVVKRPLYEKRHKIVSQIPNFWPLVFEQAPPDIDEFIQPSDSSLLLTSLTSLSVSRFEIEDGHNGDPRSLCFRFEFSDNDHFEDKVIEKKFWQRHSKSGWTGLVSEPVEIHWKKGKDLTGGLLGTVKKVWDAQQARRKGGDAKTQELSADEKSLKKKIENTGLGGLSFFAWFGYVGRNVSAEESQEALGKAQKERIARQEGKQQNPDGEDDEEDEEEEDDEDDENELEIFPEGDSLAIHISEDLWPNAIKYFSKFGNARLLENSILITPQPRPRSRTKSVMMISSLTRMTITRRTRRFQRKSPLPKGGRHERGQHRGYGQPEG